MGQVVGIEQRLRAAAAGLAGGQLELGREVQRGDLLLDRVGQAVGQDRAEHSRAHGAAQVPPELHLAGGDAHHLSRQRTLHHVDGEREGGPQPGADDDQVAHHLPLGGADADLRQQQKTADDGAGAGDGQHPIAADANHQLAGNDAEHNQPEHHRRQQLAGVGGADAQHALVDQRHEDDRTEHAEGCEEGDDHSDGEGVQLEELERHHRLARPPFNEEEADQQHAGQQQET